MDGNTLSMEKTSFVGVLLAGGAGLRLRGDKQEPIKALVEIEGRPLTYYAINFLKALKAKEIIVIGAHDFDNFKNKLLLHSPDVKIVEGDTRGSLYSLAKAWPYINDSFLLCNADHIYKKPIARKVEMQMTNGLMVFCDFDRNLGDDDMKIQHTNGVLSMISKKLTEFHGGYTGITYCSKEHISYYKQTMDKVINQTKGLVVEDVLRQLVEDGHNISLCDISGIGWLEIDFPEELARARKEIAINKKQFFI